MKPTNPRSLDLILWACQWTLAAAFQFIGMVKLGLTAEHVQSLGLATSTGMLHAVGIVEVGISLAVIVPALTRVVPQLSTVAAGSAGAIALLGAAMPSTAICSGVFWLNAVLAALAAFVVWERVAVVPVARFPEEDVAETAASEQVAHHISEPEAIAF